MSTRCVICGSEVPADRTACAICDTPVVHEKDVDGSLASAGYGGLEIARPAPKPAPPPKRPVPVRPAAPVRAPGPSKQASVREIDPFDDDPLGQGAPEIDVAATQRGPMRGGAHAPIDFGEQLGGLDDDPLEAGAPSLQVESQRPPPPRVPPRAIATQVGSGSVSMGPTPRDRGVKGGQVGPGSVSMGPTPWDHAAADGDLTAVALLAGYPVAPAGFFGAIPYVFFAVQRHLELRRMLAAAIVREGAARGDAERASEALGAALLAGDPDALEPLRAQVDAAQQAREAARRHGEVRAQSDATAGEARGQLEARIAEARAAAEPHRARERELGGVLAKHEAELRRAQAGLQRAEIELRNLQPDQEGKRPAITAGRDTRRAEVAAIEPRVRDAAAALEAARRELSAKISAVAALEEEQRRADAALTQAAGTQAAAAGQAAQTESLALRALGDAAVRHAAQRGPAGASLPSFVQRAGPAFDAATRAASTFAGASRDVTLHRRALFAWDRPAITRGGSILGSVTLVILLMLLFIVVR